MCFVKMHLFGRLGKNFPDSQQGLVDFFHPVKEAERKTYSSAFLRAKTLVRHGSTVQTLTSHYAVLGSQPATD